MAISARLAELLGRDRGEQEPEDGTGETAPKPAISEFQAILASTPPSAPQADPSGELLQQFMQWREKPDPATPQRTNP